MIEEDAIVSLYREWSTVRDSLQKKFKYENCNTDLLKILYGLVQGTRKSISLLNSDFIVLDVWM